ncbi:peroxide stress protein YaaA, partial [Pediococcus pentosaceus]
EMVNFMALNQVKNTKELKSFDRLNYAYRADLSSADKMVFIKNELHK